jgi:hypothetical protein
LLKVPTNGLKTVSFLDKTFLFRVQGESLSMSASVAKLHGLDRQFLHADCPYEQR